MTRQPHRRLFDSVLTLLALSLLALPASGCFEREENTCEYWVPKLTSAAKADKALELVKELKCKEAVPTLEKLFDDGHNRLQIVRAIREIDDRKASVSLLKKALKVKQTAKVAVGIAVDWGITDVSEELQAIMLKPTVPDARGKALEALLKSESPRKLEDLLIKVAVEDMDFQNYQVNRRAIDELGKMASVKAIPNLIQAAYMRAVKTGNRPALYQNVRMALAQIGPASVPLLIKTIKGENEDLNKYARENGIFAWELNEGPEIMQLLTDRMDTRVVEPIIDNIKGLNKPLGLNPAAEQRWVAAQQNRFTEAMLGLGAVVQDNTGLEKLGKIVHDQDADAVRQRLNAARIIAYMGTPEAQDKLIDLWEKDPMFVERQKDLFRAPLLAVVLEAIDHTRLERIKKLVEKPTKRVAEQLKDETVMAYIAALEKCQVNPDCWIEKVNSDNKWDTVKACILLMRPGFGDADKIAKAMFDRMAKAKMDEVDMRRFPLMVLARRGTEAHGKKLLEIAGQLDSRDVFWPGMYKAYAYGIIHRAKKDAK